MNRWKRGFLTRWNFEEKRTMGGRLAGQSLWREGTKRAFLLTRAVFVNRKTEEDANDPISK
jgi:hypothetical protein